MIEYSFVGTSWETAKTVRPCISSMIKQLDGLIPTTERELVVVDSNSKDGTKEAIYEFTNHFKRVLVISQRCSRGKGRQLAYRHSMGRYLVQFDLDDMHSEGFRRLLEWHRENKPDYAIVAGNTIYPRQVLDEVGGWHDLNWNEDLDLWIRIVERGLGYWYGYKTNVNLHHVEHKKISFFRRALRHYFVLRDRMALHRQTYFDYVSDSTHLDLLPRIFFGIIVKLSSLFKTDCIDVRNYSRDEIIVKMSCDLGLEGERFDWYPKGFLWRSYWLEKK